MTLDTSTAPLRRARRTLMVTDMGSDKETWRPKTEADQRFDRAIRTALATPPTPHKPTAKRAPKAKTGKRAK